MMQKTPLIRYQSTVTEDQAGQFLKRIEACCSRDFGSGFFFYRFEEALTSACEDAEYVGTFEWLSDYKFAMIHDEIVGYIFFNANEEGFYEEVPAYQPQFCIWDIYVLPEYRGQRIASQLVKEMVLAPEMGLQDLYEEMAQENKSLRIGADALNEEAGRFFNSIGFERMPPEGNDYVWVAKFSDLSKRWG